MDRWNARLAGMLYDFPQKTRTLRKLRKAVIKFRCSNCNQKVGVPDDCAGKRVKCPQCKSHEAVPKPVADVIGIEEDELLAGIIEKDKCVATKPESYSIDSPTKQCPHCGETILEIAKKCKYCKEYLDGRVPNNKGATPYSSGKAPSRMGDNAGMRLLLPVGTSGFAIASGYLGLLAFFWVPFAILAILFGVTGIIVIMLNKEKHGLGRSIFGIIMGIAFVVYHLGGGFDELLRGSGW